MKTIVTVSQDILRPFLWKGQFGLQPVMEERMGL
jgi:hypothetical protein